MRCSRPACSERSSLESSQRSRNAGLAVDLPMQQVQPNFYIFLQASAAFSRHMMQASRLSLRSLMHTLWAIVYIY